MHVKAHWTRKGWKGKFDLQIQVCGKFTSLGREGGTVCFPRGIDGEPTGLSWGDVINSQPGTCVRASDYVDVARDNLKKAVVEGMAQLKKREETTASSRPKKAQIDIITDQVTRALGGAFKGELAGVNRAEEMEMHESMLSFIQESGAADWEDLLSLAGSFMITKEPQQEPKGSGSGKAAADADAGSSNES